MAAAAQIKKLGTYPVSVQLHPEVMTTVQLEVRHAPSWRHLLAAAPPDRPPSPPFAARHDDCARRRHTHNTHDDRHASEDY